MIKNTYFRLRFIYVTVLWMVLSSQFNPMVAQTWECFNTTKTSLSVAVDQEHVWVGTTGGVVIWNKDGSIYKKLNYSNGLIGCRVYCVLIDHNKDLWFGTSQGVSKYNGATWVSYTTRDGLVADWVNTMSEDSQHHMWFGTYGGGISRFDGVNWTSYSTDDGLLSNYIFSSVVDKQNVMWFGGDKGIVSYNGSFWESYTPGPAIGAQVKAFAVDEMNNKWFGYSGITDVLYKYDGVDFTHIFQTGGSYSQNPQCMVVDKSDRIWIGTYSGVSRYDGANWVNYTELSGTSNFVLGIASDMDTTIWAGTTSGLVHFDGDNWMSFVNENEMSNNWIRSMACGLESELWFVNRLGVSGYDGEQWTNITKVNDMNLSSARCVAMDNDGRKWIGTKDSAIIFKGDESSYLDIGGADKNMGKILDLLFLSNGDKWFACSNGASLYRNNQWTNYSSQDGLIYNHVNTMASDADGGMWFGTNLGVSYFYNNTFTNYTIEDGLVHNGIVSSVIDNEGNVWFGGYGGVSKFDGQHWINYTDENGLIDKAVWSLNLAKDGSLWVGTTDGLSRYKDNEWTSLRFPDDISENEGLATMIDENDNIWIGGYYGLWKLSDVIQGIPIYPVSPIVLYPNPAKDRITLDVQLPIFTNSTYSIYTTNGRKLVEGRLQSNSLDISQLKTGVYFLEFVLDGNRRSSKLVIY